ncbi:FMN-binding protein [Chloroflexota bacterium]
MKATQLRQFSKIAFTIVLVAVMLALLACMGSSNWEALGAKEDQETLNPLQKIFPEAHFYVFDEDTEIYTLYNSSRNKIGYTFYAEGWGYIGEIVVLVGIEDKETIKGILVVSQDETPSYWRLLVSNYFFYQFGGVEIEKCYINDWAGNGGQIDAVSRATISAMGVVNAAREAALEKIKLIK